MAGARQTKIEVSPGKDGQFYWHAKAGNGATVADGAEGYVRDWTAVRGARGTLAGLFELALTLNGETDVKAARAKAKELAEKIPVEIVKPSGETRTPAKRAPRKATATPAPKKAPAKKTVSGSNDAKVKPAKAPAKKAVAKKTAAKRPAKKAAAAK